MKVKTLWDLKEEIDSRLHALETKTRFSKANWLEWLQELSDGAYKLESDIHDECYSSDQIQELVTDEIEQRERDRERELLRTEPEEHRSRFGVIAGGAA